MRNKEQLQSELAELNKQFTSIQDLLANQVAEIKQDGVDYICPLTLCPMCEPVDMDGRLYEKAALLDLIKGPRPLHPFKREVLSEETKNSIPNKPTSLLYRQMMLKIDSENYSLLCKLYDQINQLKKELSALESQNARNASSIQPHNVNPIRRVGPPNNDVAHQTVQQPSQISTPAGPLWINFFSPSTQPPSPSAPIELRVILVGSGSTDSDSSGKYRLLMAYIPPRNSVIETQSIKNLYTQDGKQVRVYLNVASALERFQSLTNQAMKNADAILLVCDVTKADSVSYVDRQITALGGTNFEKVSIVAISNQGTLANNAQRLLEKAAELGIRCFGCNLDNHQEVNEVFGKIATNFVQKIKDGHTPQPQRR